MIRLLPLLVLPLLAACATQPAYERPAVELPAAWKESAPRFAEDGKWWRIYEDAELNTLIDEALVKNADLVIAAARVDEARALVGETRAGLLPTIDARGSGTRQQVSARTATFPPRGVLPREFSDYRATL